jgi:hypothetical protein
VGSILNPKPPAFNKNALEPRGDDPECNDELALERSPFAGKAKYRALILSRSPSSVGPLMADDGIRIPRREVVKHLVAFGREG